MVLAIISLITGLIISGVAIYYSVVGLTSIFAAAAIPIIVMGVALEVAKLVATVWLKQNWKSAPFLIKSYLVTAVIILMLITSMGIFGFLSKAHLDQGMVSGDVVDKVALIDEKIKTQKDNIEASRKALRQMDESVDQLMSRSNDEKGADKAVQLRRSQAKERSRLQQEISTAQTEVSKLQGERAPIATELRKVEAEVGPIKYIASFIYGSAEQSLLEKAVTWLIIIIVVVFDPLAVILLLASQYSFSQKGAKNDEPIEVKNKRSFTDSVSTAIFETRQGIADSFNKIKGSIFAPVKQLPLEAKVVEDAKPEEVVEPNLDQVNLELAQISEEQKETPTYKVVDDFDDEFDVPKLPDANTQKEMLAEFVKAVKEAEPLIPVPAPITGFTVPKVDKAVATKGIVPINVELHKRDELDIPVLENEEMWAQRVIDENPDVPFDVTVDEWNKLLEVAEQEVEQESKKLQIIPELQKHIEDRDAPSGLADFRYVQNEEQAESSLWQETRQQVEAEHVAHISQSDYQEKVKEAIVKRLIKNLEEGSITIEEMSKDEAAAVEQHLQKEINDRQNNPNQST